MPMSFTSLIALHIQVPESVFFREYIPVQEYFIIVGEKGEYEITELRKKVVCVFPKRNGKLLGGSLAFPTVTVKFRWTAA